MLKRIAFIGSCLLMSLLLASSALAETAPIDVYYCNDSNAGGGCFNPNLGYNCFDDYSFTVNDARSFEDPLPENAVLTQVSFQVQGIPCTVASNMPLSLNGTSIGTAQYSGLSCAPGICLPSTIASSSVYPSGFPTYNYGSSNAIQFNIGGSDYVSIVSLTLTYITTTCGNGLLEPLEECDDGNTDDGNGCSAECTIESGYTCDAASPTLCTDINECTEESDDCGAMSNCFNTPGSFTCECMAGHYGDGQTCTACPEGSYNPDSGQTSSEACILCDAGTYNPGKGGASELACVDCPAGSYNEEMGQAACLLCDAGSYNESTGSDSGEACEPCAIGTYNPDAGADSSEACLPCPAGWWSNITGQAACWICPIGTFADTPGTSVECEDCPTGYFNDMTGQASCQACPAGSFTDITGQMECSLCAAGSAQDQSASDSCNTCDPGYFSDAEGSEICEACPPGSHASSTESESCDLCPEGRYNDLSAQADCMKCDPGSFTDATGQEACQLCPAGSFAQNEGSNQCTPCQDGYTSEPGSPSCSPACGDGKILGDEDCDDGNAQSGDGCNADCSAIEDGWRCPGAGLDCIRVCIIAQVSYDEGQSNPSNICLLCNPDQNAFGWSATPSGEPCDTDELACTADVCSGTGLCRHNLIGGCLIDGTCIDEGADDPQNECKACLPDLSDSAYSNKAEGLACTDDELAYTRDICNGQGVCVHENTGYCFIDEQLLTGGEADPENECQACNPLVSQDAWTDLPDGAPCSVDSLDCTTDSCNGLGACTHVLSLGCLIDGACVADGADDPNNECAACIPALASDAYSNKSMGVACTDDELAYTHDYCDGVGACVHLEKGQCEIGDAIYAGGDANPENICELCDPEADPEAWSAQVAGFPCDDDELTCTWDICNDGGACMHELYTGCLIEELCVADGAEDPDNECAACIPALDDASYSDKTMGVSCEDDGLVYTQDYCDGNGACAHMPTGQCAIGEAVYAGGASNPDNPCEVCDPDSDHEAWSVQVGGYPCGDDELACTWDICDDAGACTHPLFTGCLIDDVCVADGAPDPGNDCKACIPALDDEDYANTAMGTACADDGLVYTHDYCDGFGACLHDEKGQCVIDQTVYAGGTGNPSHPCEVCDPEADPEDWSLQVEGYPCSDDFRDCTWDICNANGVCVHPLFQGCQIAGVCVAEGENDPENDCKACIPALAGDAWSDKPMGLACMDDGLAWTYDACDGQGVCVHPATGQCAIAQAFYSGGAANPDNVCEFCNPELDPEDWSSQPEGYPCPDDGLDSTQDICNGEGLCTHIVDMPMDGDEEATEGDIEVEEDSDGDIVMPDGDLDGDDEESEPIDGDEDGDLDAIEGADDESPCADGDTECPTCSEGTGDSGCRSTSSGAPIFMLLALLALAIRRKSKGSVF